MGKYLVLVFAYDHLDHVLAALILVSRLGDIGTTYLVTPTMLLEANPIVRRLGWPFALGTLLVFLVPYFSPQLGVAILMPSLLVSASNAGRVWFARTLGEAEFKALLIRVARQSRLSHAIAGVGASASFVVLTGLVVLLFYPNPSEDWGFWIGAGIVGYGVIIGLYGSVAFVRLFRDAAVTSTRVRAV